MTIPGEVWLLIAFTSYVLMILGVLAFYRKSGNPIHILTVLVMLVHTVTVHFLHMLWVIDPVAFPWVDTASIWRNELFGPILALTWLLIAVSVFMMREDYGNFMTVGAFVFVIWSIIHVIDKVLAFVWPIADMTLYTRTFVGAIAVLVFLYATMKES